MTTVRVLPVVTDRLFDDGHPTVFEERLTRRDPEGGFDSPRASNLRTNHRRRSGPRSRAGPVTSVHPVGPSPHFSPGAVMIAEDFGPVYARNPGQKTRESAPRRRATARAGVGQRSVRASARSIDIAVQTSLVEPTLEMTLSAAGPQASSPLAGTLKRISGGTSKARANARMGSLSGRAASAGRRRHRPQRCKPPSAPVDRLRRGRKPAQRQPLHQRFCARCQGPVDSYTTSSADPRRQRLTITSTSRSN